MTNYKLGFDTEHKAQTAARLMGYRPDVVKQIEGVWCLPMARGELRPDQKDAVLAALASRHCHARVLIDTGE